MRGGEEGLKKREETDKRRGLGEQPKEAWQEGKGSDRQSGWGEKKVEGKGEGGVERTADIARDGRWGWNRRNEGGRKPQNRIWG